MTVRRKQRIKTEKTHNLPIFCDFSVEFFRSRFNSDATDARNTATLLVSTSYHTSSRRQTMNSGVAASNGNVKKSAVIVRSQSLSIKLQKPEEMKRTTEV